MRIFAGSFAAFTVLFGIKLFDNWPQLISQFNTSAPFASQAFQTYGMLIVQHLLLALVFASMLSIILQTKQRSMYDTRTSLALGLIAGMCIVAGWCIIGYFKPTVAPLWGYYSALGTSSPLLGFIYSHIIKYLQYTALFTFGVVILNYITHVGHRYVAGAAILCTFAGLVFSGYESIDVIYFWLISGIALGLLFFALWYYFVRFSVDSVPVVVAVAVSFALFQQMLFNVFPYVYIVGTLCIILILIVALFLHNRIRKLYA